MDALSLVNKCHKIAASCSRNEHVEVAYNFFERALSKIKETEPDNKLARDRLADVWYELEVNQKDGLLGGGYERIGKC
jgi:hypothetical protein